MRCWVRKVFAGEVPRGAAVLIPASEVDQNEFDKIQPGVALRADVVQPRNGGHHRKAFVLLNKLWPHTNYPTVDRLRSALTIGAGFVEDVVNPMTGEVFWVAKSWAFDAMDQIEFNELYNRMIDVALKMVPNSKRDDWQEAEDEIVRM